MTAVGGRSAYLAELFRLGGESRHVSTSELAEALGVSPPAVVKMATRLQNAGLISRTRYRGMQLTQKGRTEGVRGLRSHRLAEAFLVRVMGYGWHEAHDLADALAEIGDGGFVDRMEERSGYPRRCPHGEPIPDRDGNLPSLNDRPLLDAVVGKSVEISRVKTREAEKLQYLERLGLLPGVTIHVAGKAPFAGPIRIEVSRQEVVLGSELARTLYVAEPVPGGGSPGEAA